MYHFRQIENIENNKNGRTQAKWIEYSKCDDLHIVNIASDIDDTKIILKKLTDPNYKYPCSNISILRQNYQKFNI